MKFYIRKILSVCVLLAVTLVVNIVYAQQSFSPSIRLSYGFVSESRNYDYQIEKEYSEIHENGEVTIKDYHNTSWRLNIDADLWKVGENISFGLYMGIGEAQYIVLDDNNPMSFLLDYTIMWSGGIRGYMHLLPFMTENAKTLEKLDLSLTANLGSNYSTGSTLKTEYGLGMNLTYYPLKHLGLFAECNWGRYFFVDEMVILRHSDHLMKIGAAYRF